MGKTHEVSGVMAVGWPATVLESRQGRKALLSPDHRVAPGPFPKTREQAEGMKAQCLAL